MADWKFKTKDEIPADLVEDAKEVNGEWVVAVSSKAKVTAFRDNNIALKTENDALKGKVTAYEAAVGTDPTAIATELASLRETDQQVKDGKLKTNGDIETQLATRTKTMREGYEGQIKTLSEKNAVLERTNAETKTQLNRSIVDRHVTDAALAKDSGVNPAALPHILQQAYGVFTVTAEGKLVAKDKDAVIYGADGVSSISPKEWIGKVLEASPFFALDSKGGGADTNEKGGLGGLSQEAFDKLPPTERMALARKAKAA